MKPIKLTNHRVRKKGRAQPTANRLQTLKEGMAYPLDELASEWEIKEDTVRIAARKLGCLVYVEVEPDKWRACAVKPKAE